MEGNGRLDHTLRSVYRAGNAFIVSTMDDVVGDARPGWLDGWVGIVHPPKVDTYFNNDDVGEDDDDVGRKEAIRRII